jgi:hypothetical protein
MWPWGHLGVAYLLYTSVIRLQYKHPPRDGPLFALVFGSQFPDLVDKPLGWTVGVLPGGRTLAHSLLFATVVVTVAFIVASRYQHRELATAFSIGYLSHLLTDLPPSVLRGNLSEASFLFWPLLDQPDYPGAESIIERFLRYSMGAFEWVQLGLFLTTVLVWFIDSQPGVSLVRGHLTRVISSSDSN